MQKLKKKIEYFEYEAEDSVAEAEIREIISKIKKSKDKTIGTIELYEITHFPIEQIGRIMNKLEKEGIVKEEDD